MAFLNPLYLWAFLGLAVPVAIHLWSRKEGRTIKVGSIKLLRESHPKQASSIRLNEIWLLILRMLALSILVFILAGPVLKNEGFRDKLTYLLEPSLLQHDEMFRILDTIDPAIKLRLLATNFPSFSAGDKVSHEDIPDYWQLTREMQQLNSDSIVVFTSAYFAGFKGRRPQANPNINMVQIIPDVNINSPIGALRKGNEIEIFSVTGDQDRLEINKEMISVENNNIRITALGDSTILDPNGEKRYIPLRIADTLKVSIFHDADFEEQVKYIKSSLRAISEYLNLPIKITELSDEKVAKVKEDLVIWLSNSALKETLSPVLLWKPDSLANTIIEDGRKKNEFYLTRKLNSENIVEENLPEHLFRLLNPNNGIKEEVSKYDRRVMPIEEILPVKGSIAGKINVKNYRDISKYLWMILVILLIAERGLSAYRKQ